MNLSTWAYMGPIDILYPGLGRTHEAPMGPWAYGDPGGRRQLAGPALTSLWTVCRIPFFDTSALGRRCRVRVIAALGTQAADGSQRAQAPRAKQTAIHQADEPRQGERRVLEIAGEAI